MTCLTNNKKYKVSISQADIVHPTLSPYCLEIKPKLIKTTAMNAPYRIFLILYFLLLFSWICTYNGKYKGGCGINIFALLASSDTVLN